MGQADCNDVCPPGTFAAMGSAACTDCVAGSFSAAAGSSACTACSAGYYQPDVGQTDCNAVCPMDSYSLDGASECTRCVKGAADGFGVGFVSPKGSSLCYECGFGGWVDLTGSEECILCVHAFQCPHGIKCAEGHKGYAYGTCRKGMFIIQGRCRECPKWGKYTWLIALFLGFLLMYLVYEFAGGATPPFFTIAITHFQITALTFRFSLKYPPIVVKVLEWVLAIFLFDIIEFGSPGRFHRKLARRAFFSPASSQRLVCSHAVYFVKKSLFTLANSVLFLFVFKTPFVTDRLSRRMQLGSIV